MSTADLAVIAVTVLGLAHVAADYRLHIKVIAMLGDRLRVAPPAKAPAPEADAPNVAELEKRRTAS